MHRDLLEKTTGKDKERKEQQRADWDFRPQYRADIWEEGGRKGIKAKSASSEVLARPLESWAEITHWRESLPKAMQPMILKLRFELGVSRVHAVLIPP